MSETKRWVALTEDRNGKIHYFYKWIDEEENTAFDNFEREVKNWNVTILAIYREEDVTNHCQL